MKRFKGPSITLAQFQEVARWDGKATRSKYVSYKLYPIYSNMFYIYHILYIQMCFRYFSYDISHPWFSACVKDRTSHQRMRCVDSPLSPRKHFKTMSDKSLVWEDIAASKFFFHSSPRVSVSLMLTARAGCRWVTSSETIIISILSEHLQHYLKAKEVNVIDAWIISQPRGISFAHLSPGKVSHPTSLTIFSPLSRFFDYFRLS